MTDYEYYKSIGICVYCRKDNIYKKRSICSCLNCLEKNKEKYKNEPYRIHESRKRRQKKKKKKQYEYRKENKICPNCGKKNSNNKVYCTICLKKISVKYNNKRYQTELLNLCVLCSKNLRIENKRVCNKCYELCIEKIRKMNIVRKEKGIKIKFLFGKGK